MSKDVRYVLYKHTFPNGKVYIGITCQKPERRWSKGYGYYQNERMFRAIKKYGWDNIKHEILYEDLTEEEAYLKEIDLIAEYDSTNVAKGYNIHKGGEFDACAGVDYIDKDLLEPYSQVKNNPFQKLMLLKLFQLAIGYKYKERVDIETTENEIVISRETKYIDREVKPDAELGEMLYECYKDEIELKPYIDKIIPII